MTWTHLLLAQVPKHSTQSARLTSTRNSVHNKKMSCLLMVTEPDQLTTGNHIGRSYTGMNASYWQTWLCLGYLIHMNNQSYGMKCVLLQFQITPRLCISSHILLQICHHIPSFTPWISHILKDFAFLNYVQSTMPSKTLQVNSDTAILICEQVRLWVTHADID